MHSDLKTKKAEFIFDKLRKARLDGYSRTMAVHKTGVSEGTVYSYAKKFDFIKKELDLHRKDKRFYK